MMTPEPSRNTSHLPDARRLRARLLGLILGGPLLAMLAAAAIWGAGPPVPGPAQLAYAAVALAAIWAAGFWALGAWALPAQPLGGDGDDHRRREAQLARWRHARLVALAAATSRANHDLRGVLSPALLSAERLQMSQEAPIKRAGDVLVRSVERATEVMFRLAEQAREAPLAPSRTRLALRDEVEAAAERTRAARAGLAIENAVPDAVAVEAESACLGRLLGELLERAGEAGATRVRVSAEPGEAGCVITDDGSGLPAALADAPFQPLADPIGMTLATARDWARALGGDLALLESGERGCSFRLSLQAARSAAPAPRPPATGGA